MDNTKIQIFRLIEIIYQLYIKDLKAGNVTNKLDKQEAYNCIVKGYKKKKIINKYA